MSRFLTDLRPSSASLSIVRTNFYREEFLKHQRCLEQHREYSGPRGKRKDLRSPGRDAVTQICHAALITTAYEPLASCE